MSVVRFDKSAAEKFLAQCPNTQVVTSDYRIPFSGIRWYAHKWGTHRVIIHASTLDYCMSRNRKFLIIPVDILGMTSEKRYSSFLIKGEIEEATDYIRIFETDHTPSGQAWGNVVSSLGIPKWNGRGAPPRCSVSGIGALAILWAQISQTKVPHSYVTDLLTRVRTDYEYLLTQVPSEEVVKV